MNNLVEEPNTMIELAMRHGFNERDAQTANTAFWVQVGCADDSQLKALGITRFGIDGEIPATSEMLLGMQITAEEIGRDKYIELAAAVFGSDAIRLVLIALEEHK